MTLTLNQIITRLQTLALSHKQINHFFFGDITDWLHNESGNVLYPACFVEMNGGNVSKANRQTTYNFRVWFCDLADVAESSQVNEIEVQSDLSSIAQDFLAMLNFSEYQSEWDISESASINFYTEKFEDIVIACAVDISISSRFDSNRCQVPATDVTFEYDSSMKIISNHIQKITTESNGITIASLANKEIVMLFLGDKPLVPTTATPTANEYKYTSAIGLFEFGTDLQIDTVLQIINRPI